MIFKFTETKLYSLFRQYTFLKYILRVKAWIFFN